MISRITFFFIIAVCLPASAQEGGTQYFLLKDSTLQLTAHNAWKLFEEGKFEKRDNNSFNPGFTTSLYWLVMKPSYIENKELLLEIGTAQINGIGFYAIENNEPVMKCLTGDHHVFSSRPISSRNYVFPLSDKHPAYLVMVDKKNESLQLTYHTEEASVFQAESAQLTLVIGILTGTILLMLIFGTFLFTINRETVYLWYVLYVAAGWLYVLSNLGYGYQYIWSEDPWFAGRSRPLFLSLTVAFSLNFMELYAGKADYRWLRIILRSSMYAAYIKAIMVMIPGIETKSGSSVLSYYFLTMSNVLVIFALFAVFFTLIQKVVNKNKMAMFYLISMLPIVSLIGLQTFYYSGGIDISGSYFQHYGPATGFVIEAVILTFGLVYRFNTYRVEKELLLVNLNRQQAKYAKAIINTQENERKQLADQLHDVAGSLLSAARLNLSSVREKNFITNSEARIKLASAEEAVSGISEMLRDLSHAISPVMLDKVGFRQSVEKIAGIFDSSGKLRVELEMIGFQTNHPALHQKYSILYGILYELMNNIAKHAQATHALIQLIEHEDCLVMVVEDNGIGLTNEAYMVMDTHGLTAIQSKIHYLNGTFVLDKVVPHGLIVTIEIPKESNDKNYPG